MSDDLDRTAGCTCGCQAADDEPPSEREGVKLDAAAIRRWFVGKPGSRRVDALLDALASERARSDALWKILNDGHGPARAHSEDCRCLWCEGSR
jgi:hypothetical protein